jgi:16S rRNA (cytidine1402-2'-O)-methyltransferase
MVSYFEHNKHERGAQIIARLKGGESCAVVTDAGTPAVSDPGEDIVKLCVAEGITVTSIPGCCAAVTALTLSGMDTRRFCFEGFIPVNKGERRERLGSLENEERTMIFYEAPHKLRTTLSDMLTAFGEERQIALCRELTKLNEEVCRTTLLGAVKLYEEREPRGEYVLIVSGADKTAPKINYPADPVLHVEELVQSGMSKKDAIKAAAKARGVAKNEIYALVMKKEEE